MSFHSLCIQLITVVYLFRRFSKENPNVSPCALRRSSGWLTMFCLGRWETFVLVWSWTEKAVIWPSRRWSMAWLTQPCSGKCRTCSFSPSCNTRKFHWTGQRSLWKLPRSMTNLSSGSLVRPIRWRIQPANCNHTSGRFTMETSSLTFPELWHIPSLGLHSNDVMRCRIDSVHCSLPPTFFWHQQPLYLQDSASKKDEEGRWTAWLSSNDMQWIILIYLDISRHILTYFTHRYGWSDKTWISNDKIW